MHNSTPAPSRRAIGGYLAICVALASSSACASRGASAAAEASPAAASATSAAQTVRDIHSFARPAEARVTDVALNLRAEFDTKQLVGTATLTVRAAATARELVLDTRGLTIESVTDPATGATLLFQLGRPDSVLGRPLRVLLRESARRGGGGSSGSSGAERDTTRRIVIAYRTSPNAGALQWLSAEQTAGKQNAYLFSQGQAILTRTWIPTQDSPGIRQTYSARITVPDGLRAVMSAEQLTPDGEPATEAGWRTFSFRMQQPIAPYLIALAVGDIAFRPIGARTGVYAEPSVVDSAAREFADVERMVEAAESLFGPYRWGRYDLLVLPPSFPFGGMENPRLTFATPTILAGDRSLVSLVAHELAHSWSGNLVTNATWSDFWLNEGFTTYIEYRIMEQLYGVERARMLEALGRQELTAELAGFAADSGETVLHIGLAGRDPDAGMTQVAYEKGHALLRTIEVAVGRERFDRWLRGYFDRHAFTSLTTADFLADVRANLIGNDRALEERLRLDEWVYRPGLPSNAYVPTSDAFARVEGEVRRFVAGTPAASLATQGWSTQEWQHFLGALPATLTPAQLAGLDQAFGLTRRGNSEVLFAWLRIAIRTRYEPAMPALERFLTTQGRRKFIRPLYQDLMAAGPWGQAMAKRVYAQARPLYHPVTSGAVDAVVK